MPTREQVIEALRPVQDPELHVSVVDLDMVRDVHISNGTVGVTIALTVAGCPLRAEIDHRVKEAVGALDGVQAVEVDLASGALDITSETALDRTTVETAVREAGYALS